MFCADNWRLRFFEERRHGENVGDHRAALAAERADMNFTKAVMLHTFDGKPGYSAAQGE